MVTALSRRVVYVWLLLLALGVLIAAVEGTALFTSPPPERTGRFPVFTFGEDELGAVEAIWQGRTATVVRDPGGLWLRHDGSHRHGTGSSDAGGEHRPDPQHSRAIAEQLAVSARMLADRRMLPDRSLDAYGLVKPQLMLAFYARKGNAVDYTRPLDVLYVGDMLTTGYSYYTMRDGDREVTLIPRYQIALLLALLFGEDAAPSPLPAQSATGAGG